MVSKKMVSIFLAAGLLMSGCGKKAEQTKKSEKKTQTKQTEKGQTEDTEDIKFSVPSASETLRLEVEDEQRIPYERPREFFNPYFFEMIETAKEQLPDAVKRIKLYKTNLEIRSNYKGYLCRKDVYEIDVSDISCELDSIRCLSAYAAVKERRLEGDAGLVLHLCVNIHVVGTRMDTGEQIDDTFISTFLVSRLGMTMTMDGTEILNKGETECNFLYLDTCYGKLDHYEDPGKLQHVFDAKTLQQVQLYAYDVGITDTDEARLYHKEFWSDYDKYMLYKLLFKENGIDYTWSGDTGLEDPYKKQQETADPSMGDGDDAPWDE